MSLQRVVYRASPSLALIKYWGKADSRRNIPATSSLAVTLDGLTSTTEVTAAASDSLTVDGSSVPTERHGRFFDELRRILGTETHFAASSHNNFPTAAGLASSASGFAALTCACARLVGSEADAASLSAAARVGSASAARSLYGGITALRAGNDGAEPLYGRDHWPGLRIVVAAVTEMPKPIASRRAMELARTTSPYYESWVTASRRIFSEAVDAMGRRDLETLGELMRSSYLGMFATMFTSQPPVFYWLPESVEIIRICSELRSSAVPVFETMDAGPQVKILCEAPHLERLEEALAEMSHPPRLRVASVGGGPELVEEA